MRAPSTAARRSLRVISAVVVAVVVAAIGVGPASAHPGPKSAQAVTGSDANGTYLALGDSVAFGYVPQDAVQAPNYLDAHSFVGYPEYLAQMLNVHVANASCPGETAASLLDTSAPSNGCENSWAPTLDSLVPFGYSTFYPLHVEYQGTQMDYALHYLADHKHTRLITIDVGANDAFLCQTTNPAPSFCTAPGLGAEIGGNLYTILSDLRGAGYTGPIVVLNYYSLSYTDAYWLPATRLLNTVIQGTVDAWNAFASDNVIVASGFNAFERGSYNYDSPCDAGLLIPVVPADPMVPGGCNIHPTAAGQQLLAKAVVGALKKAGDWPLP